MWWTLPKCTFDFKWSSDFVYNLLNLCACVTNSLFIWNVNENMNKTCVLSGAVLSVRCLVLNDGERYFVGDGSRLRPKCHLMTWTLNIDCGTLFHNKTFHRQHSLLFNKSVNLVIFRYIYFQIKETRNDAVPV